MQEKHIPQIHLFIFLKIKLSLKHIATDIKKKRPMYSDALSKFSTDLGFIMQPGISTGLPVMACVNFVLVLIALAMSVNIYCKMLVLARGAHALNLLTSPATTVSTSFEPFQSSHIILVTVSLMIKTLALVVLCQRKSHHCDIAKKVPHTKITVVFFGNNDYLPVDITHTGFLAKDLKLHVPRSVLSRAYFSLFSQKIYVNWGLLSLTNDGEYHFRLPKLMTIPISKIFKARRILNELTEIHIMACTFGEYIEIYKWPIHSVPMFSSVMSTSIKPGLDVPIPSDG